MAFSFRIVQATGYVINLNAGTAEEPEISIFSSGRFKDNVRK